MKTLIILMGLQGSGKSTFYHRYLAEKYTRINLDTLKTRHRETMLFQKCLSEGSDMAIDNTNPTRADRARYIPTAQSAGYRVIGYFLESKLQSCLARNAAREGQERVPDVAILGTSKKLEMPTYEEGFDELYFVANDGAEMRISKWRTENEI